jgi:hypothetical protein
VVPIRGGCDSRQRSRPCGNALSGAAGLEVGLRDDARKRVFLRAGGQSWEATTRERSSIPCTASQQLRSSASRAPGCVRLAVLHFALSEIGLGVIRVRLVGPRETPHGTPDGSPGVASSEHP